MAPILDENRLEFVSRSPEQTRRLGARLGALLQGGDVICMEGSLGAGKTRLAQGIGRGWGVSQTLTSPTFVLVREYARPNEAARSGGSSRSGGPSRLYHVDLYRISGAEEAWGLGVDEFLGDAYAICIVEWAERARELMPPDHLWIKLDFAGHTRRALHFTAQGKRHTELLREFRRAAFGA